MKISTNRAIGITVAVIVVAALAWLAWPSPVPVDLAKAARGSMEVTVDEEARTRVRQVYTVSAPLTGHGLAGRGAKSAISSRPTKQWSS